MDYDKYPPAGHPYHRERISHDVEIRLLEIKNFLAATVFDPHVTDIPFLRHHPIKDRRPQRHFIHRHLQNNLPQNREDLAHAIHSNLRHIENSLAQRLYIYPCRSPKRIMPMR